MPKPFPRAMLCKTHGVESPIDRVSVVQHADTTWHRCAYATCPKGGGHVLQAIVDEITHHGESNGPSATELDDRRRDRASRSRA